MSDHEQHSHSSSDDEHVEHKIVPDESSHSSSSHDDEPIASPAVEPSVTSDTDLSENGPSQSGGSESHESAPTRPDEPHDTGDSARVPVPGDDSGQHDPVSSTAIQPGDFTGDLGDPDQDDNLMDLEQTNQDLEDAEEPEPVSATFTLSDGHLSVDSVENGPTPESLTTVGEMADEDLQRMRRILSEESARRGLAAQRPFQAMDTDSLTILYQQVRAELGSR